VAKGKKDLQIMYGIGEPELTETTLDHLSGCHGSRPVGNAVPAGADIGARLDSVYLHTPRD
jgi:hypothetical protein